MANKAKADEFGEARQRWGEAQARAALAELARTGESLLGFSRRKGISPQRVEYWRKKFAVRDYPARSPAFVAVTLPAETGTRTDIEIRLGAIAVVVREGCNVEYVGRLVEALARGSRAC